MFIIFAIDRCNHLPQAYLKTWVSYVPQIQTILLAEREYHHVAFILLFTGHSLQPSHFVREYGESEDFSCIYKLEFPPNLDPFYDRFSDTMEAFAEIKVQERPPVVYFNHTGYTWLVSTPVNRTQF